MRQERARLDIMKDVTNTRRLALGEWLISNERIVRESLRENSELAAESELIDLIMGWARSLQAEIREEENSDAERNH